MTHPPTIDCEQQHPSLSVSDVLAAADFYTRKLGFALGFTCHLIDYDSHACYRFVETGR